MKYNAQEEKTAIKENHLSDCYVTGQLFNNSQKQKKWMIDLIYSVSLQQ